MKNASLIDFKFAIGKKKKKYIDVVSKWLPWTRQALSR